MTEIDTPNISTRNITPEDLLALLEDRNFSEVIGAEESDSIDFKKQNYDLKIEKNQYEFAKDIAAIANSGGGVICIGYSNGEDPSRLVSYAKEAFPLGNNNLNRQQAIQVLKNRVIPHLPNDLVHFEFFGEGGEYYLAIIVKATPEEIKPLIIPWKNNQTEYFLCPHRNGSDTQSALTISQIHEYISAGMKKKISGEENSGIEEIKDKLDFITDKLDLISLDSPDKIDPLVKYLDHAKKTIDSDQGFFYITAVPAVPVKMGNFWDKEKNIIYNLLLDPPMLRKNGWNLGISIESGEKPNPIPNRWESANGTSKLTLIDNHGIIFSAGEINGFLNWGVQDYRMSDQYEGSLINNYAFVEYIDSFAKLFMKFRKDKNVLTTRYDFKFGFVLPNGTKVNLFRPPHLGHYYQTIIGPNIADESEFAFHRADEPDAKYLAGDIMNAIYVAIFGQTEGLAYVGRDEKGPFVEEERYK